MGKGFTAFAAPALAATLLLGACAPSPDSIAATPVPAGLYDPLSCSAARAKRDGVAQTLAALEATQRDAAISDVWAVVLIGIPVSLLTNGDRSGLISAQKGEIIALDARLAGCA